MRLSTPRFLVIAVALGFVIATVGGQEMNEEQALTVWQLASVGVALLIAAAAVKGFGRRALDRAARDVH